jgi:hypothetical protein
MFRVTSRGSDDGLEFLRVDVGRELELTDHAITSDIFARVATVLTQDRLEWQQEKEDILEGNGTEAFFLHPTSGCS